MNSFFQWWQAAITALWSPSSGRSDVSIGDPYGTTVSSPVNGVVLASGTNNPLGAYGSYGRQPWGGELDILTYIPGVGPQVLSLIHFDTVNVQPGQQVSVGQALGTSGGQTSGGNWPSQPRWSTGPHMGLRMYAPNDWNNMLLDPNQVYQNIQNNGGQLLWNGAATTLPPGVNGTIPLSSNPPGGGATGGGTIAGSLGGAGSVLGGAVGGLANSLSGIPQSVAAIVAAAETDVLGFTVRAGLVLLGAALLVVAVIVFFVADPQRRQETEQVGETAVIATG